MEKNTDRKPALFLELRPDDKFRVSRRARWLGRTVEAVMARSLAELGACFAPGGLILDMEGEGDDVDDAAPLVWMPGGTGRLILPGAFCTAVVVVVTLDGAIVTPDAPRRRAWASGTVLPLFCHGACYEDGPASRASVYACVAIAVGVPQTADNVNVGVAARVEWAVETIAQRGSAGAGGPGRAAQE
jgi:hypothetical protein